MKTKKSIVCILAGLLVAACLDTQHAFQPSEWEDTPVGNMAPHLVWEDAVDANTPLDNIQYLIRNTAGTVLTGDLASAQDAANWLEQLPAGSYEVLITANMGPEEGYVLSGDQVSLAEASSSPQQSYYAVCQVTVEANKLTIPDFPLQRLLPRLGIHVADAPEGTAVTVTVEHVTQHVALMERSEEGSYGMPSASETQVTLPGKGTLMPTATGHEHSLLHISVSVPDGKVIPVNVEIPRMEIGKSYEIDFQYDVVSQQIFLSSFRIDDWAEGGIVSDHQTL